jgi:acetyl esterase
MAIPKRASVVWGAVGLLERTLPSDPDRFARSLRRSRRAVTRMPGASLLTGGLHGGVQVSKVRTTGQRSLALRVYRAAGTAPGGPVVVNFHGGGWATGDPRQSDWWCSSIAALADVTVVSVAYRLAPEHRFPAAPQDCFAATEWVAGNGPELGVDPSRLAVMGDSAGGNLAAVVAIMARDAGGPPIALQVLIYPSVSHAETFGSELEHPRAPVLTKRDIDTFRGVYLGSADPADPLASPLHADLAGLPPALIQTAQYDPLRDQGAAYAAALRSAGVPVRLTNYVDAIHGYVSIPRLVPVASQAVAEAAAELRASLH